MAEPPKRKVSLPVIGSQQPAPGELPPNRSPAAWVLLGALTHFAVLLPLALLAMPLLRTFVERGSMVAIVASAVVLIGASALCAGYVVGRFGTGVRDGALSGGLAALVLWAISRSPTGFVIAAVTVPLAWLGARWGRASRKPGDTISS